MFSISDVTTNHACTRLFTSSSICCTISGEIAGVYEKSNLNLSCVKLDPFCATSGPSKSLNT